ncbi:MAG: hypothetical protein N2512_08595 [Armatimonadetes bacterium]|nr:hypothetical protein [Armatimonadota bacterium]
MHAEMTRHKKGSIVYRLAAIGLLATVALFLAGCGGVASLLWKLAGVFAAEYAREAARGYLTVAVDPSGIAEVVLVDPALGVLKGTGEVTESGRLQAILTDPQSQVSVTVNAQLSARGTTVELVGSLDGGIQSENLSGDKVAEPTENPFAGNWSGEFTGDAAGTWAATIGQTGATTLTVQTADGPVTMVGTVGQAGSVSLEAAVPGGKLVWEGAFYFREGEPVAGGTWRAPGDTSGTWTGTRASQSAGS